MTLEELNYIGELVGVVALVVSVLYLARQVGESNDLNRTDTFRSIFQGMAAYSSEMFNPENAKLMVKGYRDFGSLSPVEKVRFDHLLANYFNYAEDSYNSARVGLLGSDTIDNWSWYLRTRLFPLSRCKRLVGDIQSGLSAGISELGGWCGAICKFQR
jgi:hypothetical protein